MAVSVGDELDLVIKDVAYPGKGVARHEGQVIFVRGVIPGETVRATVTTARRRYAEATLMDVTEPSPHRISPACPLAGTCPGCTYLHMDYEEELRLKQCQLADVLRKLGGMGDVPFREPVASPSSLNYRNKIALHVLSKRGDVRLGYVGADNRTIIDIAACPLAHVSLNKRLSVLRKDEAFMGGLRTRDEVVLRVTEKNGAISWVAGKTHPTETWLEESTTLGPLRVHHRGFFQVNPGVLPALVDEVVACLTAAKVSAAIDLYCGVGILALAAGRAGIEAVLGVDENRRAIRAAERNAEALELPSVEFRCGPAEELIGTAMSYVDAQETAVLVDPPRRGLSPEALTAVIKAAPSDLVYISCAPDTLARDVKKLGEAGYSVQSCRLLDMFPRTSHFETVTHLQLAR